MSCLFNENTVSGYGNPSGILPQLCEHGQFCRFDIADVVETTIISHIDITFNRSEHSGFGFAGPLH